MCKPYNGKMKEFKWRPGIFKKRLLQLQLFSQIRNGALPDERFHRTLKRLSLFVDLERFNIQPPCHWNYSLVADELKIGLMNTECPCGINTDKIHYMDMNELEFNEDGQAMFTPDHDVDFGLGGFYEIEMWTYSEENKIHQLVEKMDKSSQKEKRSIRAEIVKFIDDTMASYEHKILTYEFSAILEGQVSAIIKESMLQQNTRKLEAFFFHKRKSSSQTVSKPKKVLTSRQKRLQADAIQAAKDAEEAKMKQLEKRKSESVDPNGKKKKKNAKTHFRKSQKPARL